MMINVNFIIFLIANFILMFLFHLRVFIEYFYSLYFDFINKIFFSKLILYHWRYSLLNFSILYHFLLNHHSFSLFILNHYVY